MEYWFILGYGFNSKSIIGIVYIGLWIQLQIYYNNGLFGRMIRSWW